MTSTVVKNSKPSLLRQYWVLTKPRVTQLAVFCAVIGMFLATPGLPDLTKVAFATVGIWLLAAAAFAINCLIEQQIDAKMTRTARRGTAAGTIPSLQVLMMSGLLGGVGMFMLYRWVNPLTMWLTFATFVGYAVIYTVILKPRTPQNIVIGGLSGAMPPALGWAAIADAVPPEAWLLVLIIFIWTPPHFWALALYRTKDYASAGLPMLPYVIGMSGSLYLAFATVLGGWFVLSALRLYRAYSDELARNLFRDSIIYLSLLFASLLIDHWLVL